MSATTTQLLSSGEFCKVCYDAIPVKSASANVFSIPIPQKCQISSWDSLVADERYIYIYIYNFIHSILIKPINNDTFKNSVQTTALVHAFIRNSNTLINSQPPSERFWNLSFSHLSNLSCYQQMPTLNFIAAYMHNNKQQSISHLRISIQFKFKIRSSQVAALQSFRTFDDLKSIET